MVKRNAYFNRAKLGRDESGTALIEFAVSFSILLIMFFGAVEISRYLLIVQKVEKTIATTTDVLTQADPSDPLNDGYMQDLLANIPNMMNPYNITGAYGQSSFNGMVIYTDVMEPSNGGAGGTPTIQWQVCGGTLVTGRHSALGTWGGAGSNTAATLPANFTTPATPGTVNGMMPGEETVFGEIFYNYSPITVGNVTGPTVVYRMAVYFPRFQTLAGYSPSSVGGSFTCP
jgi:Flp pilus assembly protein TadG